MPVSGQLTDTNRKIHSSVVNTTVSEILTDKLPKKTTRSTHSSIQQPTVQSIYTDKNKSTETNNEPRAVLLEENQKLIRRDKKIAVIEKESVQQLASVNNMIYNKKINNKSILNYSKKKYKLIRHFNRFNKFKNKSRDNINKKQTF